MTDNEFRQGYNTTEGKLKERQRQKQITNQYSKS